MRLRRLLAVAAAVLITGGIVFFARTRPDEGRGAVTIWYIENDSLGIKLEELGRSYNSDFRRNGLPVKFSAFPDEQALAAACEDALPDLLLCSHYRAFGMHERGILKPLSDIAAGPDYPQSVLTRSACVGKSWFPMGMAVPVLLCSEELATKAPGDFEELCNSVIGQSLKDGKPALAVDSYGELFYSLLLRKGESFDAAMPEANAGEAFAGIYNTLAEVAYKGALAFCGGESLPYVLSGKLDMAIVSSYSLAGAPKNAATVLPLPDGDKYDCVGEAYGLAVTARGSRSINDISEFICWLFEGNRASSAALGCGLVPAENCSLITRVPLWQTLIDISENSIVSLPAPESEYVKQRETFDTELEKRLISLAS